MSKPILEDLFKFSGRRNRKSYILLGLAQFAALIGLVLVTAVATALLDSFAPLGYLLMLGVVAGYIAIFVSAWAAGSQRIRDFGQSGVWILLALIPYVGWVVCLAICFIPSDPGDNRYGPSQITPQLST
jgi:uncharacterized membrane protein YhaH (DUF805 family)